MLTKDFSFELPPELIAQKPTTERGKSRLLVLDRANNKITHSMVSNIADFLPENAVMVFNDSKVRRSRLYAKTEFGGDVEVLLLRREHLACTDSSSVWTVITNRMAKQKIGKTLLFPESVSAKIIDAKPDERVLRFSIDIDDKYLERNGHLPLPPYINRKDIDLDSERYQTIYAKETGSSAAPTAGLHFTDEIISSIQKRGIETCFVTLHVGLGTFLPVREDNIENHHMHCEEYHISKETADIVTKAKKDNRPIVAVGTTSLRTLESAWDNSSNPGVLPEGFGKTEIFIYPGYKFKCVDKLFTNFHTPESTLLMLVSAFAGQDKIMNAYQEAIKERYRFFSYGDAMYIL